MSSTFEGYPDRKKILCHVTSPEIAKLIVANGFKPGKAGMLGPGIYFGDSIEDCLVKAHQKGCYIVCTVHVGKSLVLSGRNWGSTINQNEVAKKGCMSVHWMSPPSGEEWVVYDPSRIVIMEVNEYSSIPQGSIAQLYASGKFGGSVIPVTNGFGIKKYPNGAVFEGYFKNGKREGKGKDTYGPNDYKHYVLYEGDHAFRHGFGKMIYSDGTIYDGQWSDGKRNGYGVSMYNPGNKYVRYDGDYFNDEKHGKGTMEFPDGSVYEGDWKYGHRNGRGVITYNLGNKYIEYDGKYRNDKKHGIGTMVYADGRTYTGRWRNGEREDGKK